MATERMGKSGEASLVEKEEITRDKKEDRSIVTPYAFSVTADLIGQKLATPLRRLSAITIDLIVIALLSSVNVFFLSFAVTYALYRLGFKKSTRRWVNRLIFAAVMFMMFLTSVIAYDVVRGIFFEEKYDTGNASLNVGVQLAKISACKNEGCRHGNAKALVINMQASDLPVERQFEIYSEFIASLELTKTETDSLLTLIEPVKKQVELNHAQASQTAIGQDGDIERADEASSSELEGKQTSIGIIAWVRAILADLGLGFGWAAAYFSILTASWRGQTIGKRLLGLRVVLLDGRAPNLWESFGRYGGYGAGLSTGLLGFLQIYWDPNRQAIQDKISETLVVRD